MDLDSAPAKFWHCRVSLADRKHPRDIAVANDITKDQLQREIITPWHQGRPFTVSGKIVKNRDGVEDIRIVHTDHPMQRYADIHNASMQASGIADMATDRRLLPFGKGKDYTNELLFQTLADQAPAPDIALLLRVCERLPDAARSLATRRKGKVTYEIKDEYDVQDLLHSIIRAYFKYSVNENPIGKVGGGPSSLADFSIDELGTIIEAKFVRGPNDQTRIVEEFAQDLLLYSKWAPLETFIYLVYNSRDLRDPEALEKLAGPHEIAGKKYRTYIVLA